MAEDQKLELMLEAESRGILPEQEQGLLNEARSRGLIDAAPAQKEPKGPGTPNYKGSILPFSTDEQGEVYFDPDVGIFGEVKGIFGAIKRAVMLPGDVVTGKVDPQSPEGLQRAAEAAVVISPLPAASRVGKAVGAPGSGYKAAKPGVPTREALRAETNALYKRAGDLDARYQSSAVKQFADDLQAGLNEDGLIAELAPEVHVLVKKFQNPPADSFVTIRSLDAFRKRLNAIAGSLDGNKAEAASRAIGALDDFLEAAGSQGAVAGATTSGRAIGTPTQIAAQAERSKRLAEEVSRTIKEARGNAAAGFRSDKVTGLEDAMGLRAAAANSGRNVDNAARQRLTSLLLNRRDIRGFSAAEQSAIRDIINGRPTKNAARYVGNLLGGGGGLGQLLTTMGLGAAGGATAGGEGAAAGIALPVIIGALSKALANSMTKAELRALDRMVRARSPLGKSMTGGPVYAPSALQGKGFNALIAGEADAQGRQ